MQSTHSKTIVQAFADIRAGKYNTPKTPYYNEQGFKTADFSTGGREANWPAPQHNDLPATNSSDNWYEHPRD